MKLKFVAAGQKAAALQELTSTEIACVSGGQSNPPVDNPSTLPPAGNESAFPEIPNLFAGMELPRSIPV